MFNHKDHGEYSATITPYWIVIQDKTHSLYGDCGIVVGTFRGGIENTYCHVVEMLSGGKRHIEIYPRLWSVAKYLSSSKTKHEDLEKRLD